MFLSKCHTIADIENLIEDWDDLMNEICEDYGGVIRNVAGDQYLLSFLEVHQALAAMEKLQQRWSAINHSYNIGLLATIHAGDINILRSYVYSNDINVTVGIARYVSHYIGHAPGQNCVLVSRKIKDAVKSTNWEQRLQELDRESILDDADQAFVKEHGVYRFKVDGETPGLGNAGAP